MYTLQTTLIILNHIILFAFSQVWAQNRAGGGTLVRGLRKGETVWEALVKPAVHYYIRKALIQGNPLVYKEILSIQGSLLYKASLTIQGNPFLHEKVQHLVVEGGLAALAGGGELHVLSAETGLTMIITIIRIMTLSMTIINISITIINIIIIIIIISSITIISISITIVISSIISSIIIIIISSTIK